MEIRLRRGIHGYQGRQRARLSLRSFFIDNVEHAGYYPGKSNSPLIILVEGHKIEC